jgi:hypothetical protein
VGSDEHSGEGIFRTRIKTDLWPIVTGLDGNGLVSSMRPHVWPSPGKENETHLLDSLSHITDEHQKDLKAKQL